MPPSPLMGEGLGMGVKAGREVARSACNPPTVSPPSPPFPHQGGREKNGYAARTRVMTSSYWLAFSAPSKAPYSHLAITSSGGKITGLFL